MARCHPPERARELGDGPEEQIGVHRCTLSVGVGARVGCVTTSRDIMELCPIASAIPEPPAEASRCERRAVLVLARRPSRARPRQHAARALDRRVETLVGDGDLAAWLVGAELMPAPRRVPRRLARRGARAARGDRRLRRGRGRRRARAGRGGRGDRRLARASPARARSCRIGATGEPVLGERAAGRLAAPRARPDRARRRRACSAIRPSARAIRICAADDCSARFYDRSPAGRRRWCSMQRLRQRRQGPPPPRPPQDGRVNRYRWVILGVGVGARRVRDAAAWACPRSAPALRDDLRRSRSPRSACSSPAVPAGVTLTLLPWGMLTDRVGERPVLAGRPRRAPRWRSASPRSRRASRAARRRPVRRGRVRRERHRRQRAARSWAGSRAPSAAWRSGSARWRCRSAAAIASLTLPALAVARRPATPPSRSLAASR